MLPTRTTVSQSPHNDDDYHGNHNDQNFNLAKLCLYLVVEKLLYGCFGISTLPTGEVGQKYYALKKSSPFVNSG